MGNKCSCTSEKTKAKKEASKGNKERMTSAASEAKNDSVYLLSNCKGNKRALLIGINYFGQAGELGACINDVNNMKSLITSRGFTEDQGTVDFHLHFMKMKCDYWT